MIGHVTDNRPRGEQSDHMTRIDLAVMSVTSLLFGLAIIVRGFIHH